MTWRLIAVAAVLIVSGVSLEAQNLSYLGFDRNDYPGDSNLKTLRQTFAYAGYWLNIPPGAKANTWPGHRATVEAAGFGFLVLFNGRLYAELKSEANARRMGKSDGSMRRGAGPFAVRLPGTRGGVSLSTITGSPSSPEVR